MKTQFDKIYVISLITNKDRQKFIKYQFNELGLEFEFIYSLDFYKIRTNKFKKRIVYPSLTDYAHIDNYKMNSVTIAQYKAVLQAYEFGYNNVLIVEDDICFTKNKEMLEYYLNNIPKYADYVNYIVRFIDKNEIYSFFKKYSYIYNPNNEYGFIKLENTYKSLCGSMIHALMNRNIMKLYLDNQRKSFSAVDHVNGFFENPIIKRYTAIHAICLDQSNKLTKNNNENHCYKIYNSINDFDDYYEPTKYHISNINKEMK